MKLPIYNQDAANVGTMELSDAVFGAAMNADLLHQVTTSQIANRRQTLAHTKGRGDVRGGGKKPWQQKGTGRARHGSIRSPIWKGGGVTHGPNKESVFKKKINVKMARKALAIALSSKVRDGQMALVDDITLAHAKTKAMAVVVHALAGVFGAGTSTSRMLVVVPSAEKRSALGLPARNISSVDVIEARNMNALKVLTTPHIVVLKDAIGVVEKIIA